MNEGVQITPDQWIAKYGDTHTELQAMNFTNNHTIKKSGTDPKYMSSGLKPRIEGEKKINQQCREEREEKVRQLFFDLLQVRNIELLSKEDFPMTHLVNTICKLMPQRNENKNETSITFSEQMKRAKLEFERTDVIDAEGNPI